MARSWEIIDTWDYSIDGTSAIVDFKNLTWYDDIQIIISDVTRTANSGIYIRLSTDGGNTFYDTNGDYIYSGDDAIGSNNTRISTSVSSGSSSAVSLHLSILALQLAGVPKPTPKFADYRYSFKGSTNRVNAIRFYCDGSAALNSGKIQIIGLSNRTIDFSDGASFGAVPSAFITNTVTDFDTPGTDHFDVPPYERIIVEVWGGGAPGISNGTWWAQPPLFGTSGSDSKVTFADGTVMLAGGAAKGLSQVIINDLANTVPGQPGLASGGNVINAPGSRGGARRKVFAKLNTTGPITHVGALGAPAPYGGDGGGWPTIVTGQGFFFGEGVDGTAPGAGGSSWGVSQQLADYGQFSNEPGGSSGAYCKSEWLYGQPGCPDIGSRINLVIGAGGAAATGFDFSPNLQFLGTATSGDGADGFVRITVIGPATPPLPDTGQGTISIATIAVKLRPGAVLNAAYHYDDPDGGEFLFRYQWRRNGVAISEANSPSYVLVDADTGADIDCAFTYTDSTRNRVTIYSNFLGPVLIRARPLDDYASGLYAAYSTRHLVSSYTGPLMRVFSNVSNSNDAYAWRTTAAQPISSSMYFLFDFGHARLVTETAYHHDYNGGVSLGVWQWQGSNDGSTWTNIGSAGGVLDATVYDSDVKDTSLNGNTTAYRYYKLLGVSGTFGVNSSRLFWVRFKIDDDGLTHGVMIGQQSYDNPNGSHNRNGGLTITTTLPTAAGAVTNLVRGGTARSSEAFWPDPVTGDLNWDEIKTFFTQFGAISSGNTVNIYMMYDQSGHGRNTGRGMFDGWGGTNNYMNIYYGTTSDFYRLPNGRIAPQTNGVGLRTLAAALSPGPTYTKNLSFSQVIVRGATSPINFFEMAGGGGSDIGFSLQVNTAQDWTANAATLFGGSHTSGTAPRAIANNGYATLDTDAVQWSGTIGPTRTQLQRNGVSQALAVKSTGNLPNRTGNTNYVYFGPFNDGQTGGNTNPTRIAELVLWEGDKLGEMLPFQVDQWLTYLKNVPSVGFVVTFSDGAELDDGGWAPGLPPFEGTVTFSDGAYMTAILAGHEPPLEVAFYDNSVLSVAVVLPEPTPLPIQTVIVMTGF